MEKAAVDLDRLAEEWGEVGRWADTAPADAAVAAQFPRSAEIADAVTAAAAVCRRHSIAAGQDPTPTAAT